MTDPKTPDDLLGAYTDDLLADRRPRLHEDMASVAEADRADVPHLASLVRRLKAAHTEPPPPTEMFLARLDSTVTSEVAARAAHHAAPAHPERGFLAAAKDFFFGWRWQFAGCAVAAVLLIFQAQVIMQVRALQAENRTLTMRLERLATSDRMVPLGLQADIGLRLRIEHRIAELEKERTTTTGAERQAVERAIQELRALMSGAPGQ